VRVGGCARVHGSYNEQASGLLYFGSCRGLDCHVSSDTPLHFKTCRLTSVCSSPHGRPKAWACTGSVLACCFLAGAFCRRVLWLVRGG